MYDIVLAFITAFILTYLAIPSIISIARKKNLVDEPGERRAHTVSTPSLGGIGIFAGVIFSIILWTPFTYFGDLQYILCAFIIIFLIGAKDDIDPIAPKKKFAGELFAAFILVFIAKIKITSFYGIFGIEELPDIWSYIFSMFTIIVIINAFNLIDGINGLSGSIGALICCTFGTWFLMIDKVELAIVAFAMAGSTIAFLYYNVTPARIFMGDTGSLLLGLVCSILAIQFIEQNKLLVDSPYFVGSAPSVAIGIMILPLFDTMRVFVLRVIKGKSPFSPDKNHIHHLLLEAGLNHMQSTCTLVIVNVIFILVSLYFQFMGTEWLLFILVAMALLLTLILLLTNLRKRVPSNI